MRLLLSLLVLAALAMAGKWDKLDMQYSGDDSGRKLEPIMQETQARGCPSGGLSCLGQPEPSDLLDGFSAYDYEEVEQDQHVERKRSGSVVKTDPSTNRPGGRSWKRKDMLTLVRLRKRGSGLDYVNAREDFLWRSGLAEQDGTPSLSKRATLKVMRL
jgi:hypothetical protein